MKSFLGKRILAITAHPDDESYVLAGTLHENHRKGGENFLICGSFGEKGTSHVIKEITKAELKRIREKELLKACNVLHIKQVKILGFADGQLKDNKLRLFDKVMIHVKRIKPDVIVSFGSDGISGHYDHITVGRVAQKIAKKLNISFFAASLPPKLTTDAQKFLLTRRKAGHYKNVVTYKKPDIRITINQRIKKQALRSHASQMDNKNAFTGFPRFAVKELLKAEFFISD